MILALILASATPEVSVLPREEAVTTTRPVEVDNVGGTFLPLGKGGRLSAGLYEGRASIDRVEAWADDEFMLIIQGSITMTSASGRVTRLGPGDAAFVPKGWKGEWNATAYRKYVVSPR
jgi:uncharacterized cupin superfamily protein